MSGSRKELCRMVQTKGLRCNKTNNTNLLFAKLERGDLGEVRIYYVSSVPARKVRWQSSECMLFSILWAKIWNNASNDQQCINNNYNNGVKQQNATRKNRADLLIHIPNLIHVLSLEELSLFDSVTVVMVLFADILVSCVISSNHHQIMPC
jgi:hypothetical protein